MSKRTPNSPIVLSRSRNGHLRVDFVDTPHWNDFTNILKFLENVYGAAIVRSVDGPDARKAVLRVRGQTLELVHEDPWGNFLSAADAEGDATLSAIAEDVGKRNSS